MMSIYRDCCNCKYYIDSKVDFVVGGISSGICSLDNTGCGSGIVCSKHFFFCK